MVDFDTAMPIYHQLSDYSDHWVYVETDAKLARVLGAAAAFAVDGSPIEVADVQIAVDDGDLEAIEIVILTTDRLVTISHKADGEVKTIVRSRTAIRSAELLKVPDVLADRQWGETGL